MNCLIDFILIEGVPEKALPNSGLYINRELSIPMLQITKMINSSQGDLTGIWNEVQVRGYRKFILRVQLGMQELFKTCVRVDDAWLCKNKVEIQTAWMYYLGMELMIERRHTDRINRFTTIDKERAEEMFDEFSDEFKVQLKAALYIINSSKGEEIADISYYVESLP